MADQVSVVDQAGGVEIPAGYIHLEGIPVTLRAPIVVDVAAANLDALTAYVAGRSGVKVGSVSASSLTQDTMSLIQKMVAAGIADGLAAAASAKSAEVPKTTDGKTDTKK